MRSQSLRWFLVGVLILTAGCASHNKGKLEGTSWVSEATTVNGKDLPAGARMLEFRADKTFIYHILAHPEARQELKGKWSLNSGDSVTLHLEEKLGGRKQHVEKVVIDGNQLTMTDSDGTSVTFARMP